MCVFIVGKVDAQSKPTQHRDAAIGCDSFNHGAFYSAPYQPEVHRFPCRNYEESFYRREADNFPPRAVFQASSGGFYEQPHSSAPPQAFLRHDNAGGHMIVPRDVFQTGPRYSDQSRPFGYFGHNNFNYETDYYASRQTSVNRCMYPHQPPPPNAAFYGAHQDNLFRHSSNYM